MNKWRPRRGYSDTLRERWISVWGTRRISPFTQILMLATATVPTILAPFQVTCAWVQEDQWHGARKRNRWLQRIGVYRTSIREPRSRISVWFVDRIYVSPVFFCAHVRGQHGSSSAITYYSILVKDQTHFYDYHALHELVASNKITVPHVKTADQLANIPTKILGLPQV